jgi:hypothetical protein
MVDAKQELELAIQQLEILLEEREKLEVKIAKQRQKVAAWGTLAAQDDEDSTQHSLGSVLNNLLDRESLTNACCTVLKASTKEWMKTSDIQTALRDFGFDLTRYISPHSAIMTTVQRLVEKGQVATQVNGSVLLGSEYKWIGSRFSAARAGYGAPNSLANLMARQEINEINSENSPVRLISVKEAQLRAGLARVRNPDNKKGEK